jgi:alpha-tubulin suppressor-like RCC1 family protein
LGNTIDQSTPQLISTLKNENIKNVVCGAEHSIIITGNLNLIKETEKGVFSCGNNNFGQLGLGNTTKQTTPQLISSLKNEKIKNVVCGGQHSFVITGKFKFIKEIENGVYTFGSNNCGQLGLENTTKQTTPQLISTLKNEKIKNVVCGGQHSMIITGKFKFH